MDAKALIEFLKARHWTLGSVESFTGGLFAKTITDIPGASQVFKGCLVTYANETKVSLLNIPEDSLATNGAVSSPIASLMAANGQKALHVDLCVSFTGNAGPDAMDHTKVGTCFIGLVTPFSCQVFALSLQGSRQDIRQAAVERAIAEIMKLPISST